MSATNPAIHNAILVAAYRAKAAEALELARQALKDGRHVDHCRHLDDALFWRAQAYDAAQRGRDRVVIPLRPDPRAAVSRRFADCYGRLSAALAADKVAGRDELSVAIRNIRFGDGSAESTVKCCDEIDCALERAQATAREGAR
jgi:hypothetical protein